jgi:hypothetical protein
VIRGEAAAYPFPDSLQIVQSGLHNLVTLVEDVEEAFSVVNVRHGGVAHPIGQHEGQALLEIAMNQYAGVHEAAQQGLLRRIPCSFLSAATTNFQSSTCIFLDTPDNT